MALSLFQILVPCNFNDGKPIRTRHHREWDKQVQKITGGMTILPPGRGKWIDQETDTNYIDRVIPVNIIASDEDMKRIAKITIKHYKQLAVLYYRLSNEPHIVYASDE